jgi:hypothetical protein
MVPLTEMVESSGGNSSYNKMESLLSDLSGQNWLSGSLPESGLGSEFVKTDY